MKTFDEEIKTGLVWLPELGIGRFPVPVQRPYDESYFSRYQQLADTPMGRELTTSRIRLVDRYFRGGSVVDVGIGSGQFVEMRPQTKGFDVNPAGVQWLKERGLWADLYATRHDALTFWDSLEHIDRPDFAVAQADKWVFVSVPIFCSAEHILRSRHFRRDEHIWYWTHDGLIGWFQQQGFRLAEHNMIESDLGRDGIGSYAFYRKE